MTKSNDDSKLQLLIAQTKALEHLQAERRKLNDFIAELKEDYFTADDPLKAEIEKKAEDSLKRLNDILTKLKQLA